jgi:hypothetical protein
MERTHNISLRPNSNQTIDMFANRNQDLPSHMPALLRPRRLVLNMDTRSTLLNKQLGQFHDGSQASMSRISVGDDGAQVIDVGELGAVGFRGGCDPFFALLAVVEELRLEEVLHFVWDGCLEV